MALIRSCSSGGSMPASLTFKAANTGTAPYFVMVIPHALIANYTKVKVHLIEGTLHTDGMAANDIDGSQYSTESTLNTAIRTSGTTLTDNTDIDISGYTTDLGVAIRSTTTATYEIILS